MSIEGALFTYLTAQAPIMALLGKNPTRLYRDVLPELVDYPAVSFFRVGTPHVATLDAGPSISKFQQPRFQFDAWSADVADSNGTSRSGADDTLNITQALVLVLDGFRGVISDAEGHAVRVRAVLMDDEGERADFEKETRTFHRMVDFQVTIET